MWRPRSLRLRYTLRALFVFITLFMLWGGYHANRGWRERAAEKVLREHGIVALKYGRERDTRNAFQRVACAYEWIVQCVWQERYITEITVSSNLDPEVVSALASLPHLESLSLHRPRQPSADQSAPVSPTNRLRRAPIPCGALERVLAQANTNWLFISGYILGEDDCQAIANHVSLQHVELSDVTLSDDSLAHLLLLPRLRRINVSMSDVLGDELAVRSGSPTLEGIAFRMTPLSNGLGAFASRCPNLRQLQVTGRSIDDAFVAALGPHPVLEHLSLPDTSVSDKSLQIVQQMRSLQSVGLPRKTVSQEGIAKLKSARPKLRIIH